MTIFDRCMEVVFANEGGYVWHPADPGGETKYGIAKKFFPDEDIQNLTKKRAKSLYRKHYWKPMNLEGINDDDLILQIFDFGVNAGPSRSIKLIQCIAGAKPVDGICGPVTKSKINSFIPIKKDSGTYSAIDLFKEGRKHYYVDLANRKPVMNVFLPGWLNRIEKTKF